MSERMFNSVNLSTLRSPGSPSTSGVRPRSATSPAMHSCDNMTISSIFSPPFTNQIAILHKNIKKYQPTNVTLTAVASSTPDNDLLFLIVKTLCMVSLDTAPQTVGEARQLLQEVGFCARVLGAKVGMMSPQTLTKLDSNIRRFRSMSSAKTGPAMKMLSFFEAWEAAEKYTRKHVARTISPSRHSNANSTSNNNNLSSPSPIRGHDSVNSSYFRPQSAPLFNETRRSVAVQVDLHWVEADAHLSLSYTSPKAGTVYQSPKSTAGGGGGGGSMLLNSSNLNSSSASNGNFGLVSAATSPAQRARSAEAFLMARVRDLETQLTRLKREQENTSQFAKMQVQVDRSEESVRVLKQKLDEKEAMISQLRLEKHHATLRSDGLQAHLNAALSNTKSSCAVSDETVVSLTKQVRLLEKEAEHWKSSSEKTLAAVRELESQSEAGRSRERSFEQVFEDMKNAAERDKAMMEDQQKMIAQLHQQLLTERSQSEGEVNRLAQELGQIRGAYEDAQRKLKDQQQYLQSSLTAAPAEIESKDTRILELETELQRKNAGVTRLQEELTYVRETVTSLREELRVAQNENETLKKKIVP